MRSESRYTQYNIGQIHQFIGYDCAESYFYYETCFYIYIIFRINIVLSLNMLYIKKSYKHFIVYNMKKWKSLIVNLLKILLDNIYYVIDLIGKKNVKKHDI